MNTLLSLPPRAPTLLEISQQMRFNLCQALVVSGRPPDTNGACGLGSILVHTAINAFTPLIATIKGGSGESAQGFLGDDKLWHGHYWVEVETPQGCMLIDITADQFGGEPIVCELLAAVAQRYNPGDQQEVDNQIQALNLWLNPAS